VPANVSPPKCYVIVERSLAEEPGTFQVNICKANGLFVWAGAE
jgi:hypothetical protein